MWFSIVALLTVTFSATDAAETYSIRPGQVDGAKHILISPNVVVVFTVGKEDGTVKAILR